MEDGERANLAAALRARLAAAGLEVPADHAGRMERDLGLHLERLAALAAAADLGPADPPLTSLPPLPPGEARTAPPARPPAPGPRAGEPGGLVEAARLVREGTASSAELVEAALARIEALDGRLGAFVTLLARESRSEAAAGDAQQRRGEALGTDAAGVGPHPGRLLRRGRLQAQPRQGAGRRRVAVVLLARSVTGPTLSSSGLACRAPESG
jgi:hypothetical protein